MVAGDTFQTLSDLDCHIPHILHHWTAVGSRWGPDTNQRQIRRLRQRAPVVRGAEETGGDCRSDQVVQAWLFDGAASCIDGVDLAEVRLHSDDVMAETGQTRC